jgi:hypothetical protein
MTTTARKLIDELEDELAKLPEKEQEACVSTYLEDIHQRQKKETEEKEPYSFFKVLMDADLDLPPDYSETYEEHLYGIEKQDD